MSSQLCRDAKSIDQRCNHLQERIGHYKKNPEVADYLMKTYRRDINYLLDNPTIEGLELYEKHHKFMMDYYHIKAKNGELQYKEDT